MKMLLFLDFDGVLRRETSNPSRFDSDCLEIFETVVRQYANLEIVISSTWRLAIPLRELRKLFSPDVAVRIVGITPEIDEEETYERYEEIKSYFAKKSIDNPQWVAIDDNPAHFPKHIPILLTDSTKGFDDECAIRLQNILDSFTKSPQSKT